MPDHRRTDPARSVLAFFAAELTRLREAARLTHTELADRIHYSRSMIAMIETAQRLPSRDFADACDRVLHADGLLTRLWPLVDRTGYTTPPPPYTHLEATATTIRSYQPHLIDDLLQTEDYTRAVLTTRHGPDHPDLDHRLHTLKQRQHTLLTHNHPPYLSVLLDEAVLHHTAFTTPETHTNQLTHLLHHTHHNPHLTLRVLPLNVPAHALLDGPLRILSFPDAPDIAYTTNTHRTAASDLDHYRTVFDRASAEALTPTGSRDLITALLNDPNTQPDSLKHHPI